MMMVRCAGCDAPIQDRFLMTVMDKTWHSGCVFCCVCRAPLADRCFSRDGRLFCRDDFLRMFGTKCAGCSQVILPHDLVRRARDRIYHVACFVCMACKRELSTGEQLHVISDCHFLCGRDYFRLAEEEQALEGDELHGGKCGKDFRVDPSRKISSLSEGGHLEMWNKMEGERHFDGRHSGQILVAMKHEGHDEIIPDDSYDDAVSASGEESPPSSPGNDPTLGADQCSRNSVGDPGKVKDVERNILGEVGGSLEGAHVEGHNAAKRRGPRTTIKAKQLETLKNAFANTPKPTRHIREQLAQETGLNMRVIQVWFQNRRSKERRMKQFNAQGLRRNFFRNPRRVQRGSILGESMNNHPHLLLRDYYTKGDEMGAEFLTRPHPCANLHGCYPSHAETSELYEPHNIYAGTEVLYPDFYSPIGLNHATQATNQMQGLVHPLVNQRVVASTVSSLVSANQVPELNSGPIATAQFLTANSNLLNLLTYPAEKISHNSSSHQVQINSQSQRDSDTIGRGFDLSEMGHIRQFMFLPSNYDYDNQLSKLSTTSPMTASSFISPPSPTSSLTSHVFGNSITTTANIGSTNEDSNNNDNNNNNGYIVIVPFV